MGYDVHRFEGDVDEELICSICGGVYESPVQAPQCEHIFCVSCINEWLKRGHASCPVDRSHVDGRDLVQPPRIVRNLLARLKIACDNASFGCQAIVKLDALDAHLTTCKHNPKRPVDCEKGCGSKVPLDELLQHNCVRSLREKVNSLEALIHEHGTLVQEQGAKLREQNREICLLKDMIRSLRLSHLGPSLPLEDAERRSQIAHWMINLSPARVSRWGGMISTPDAVLQAVIKRALIDSNCPTWLCNELMENAHERKWPPGLSSLETRQLNRRRYEQYNTKRIPGKQAVVVMHLENEHMGDSMTAFPGLVLIFAHGIE